MPRSRVCEVRAVYLPRNSFEDRQAPSKLFGIEMDIVMTEVRMELVYVFEWAEKSFFLESTHSHVAKARSVHCLDSARAWWSKRSELVKILLELPQDIPLLVHRQ